jgi:DNA-binding Lrp family transcriptional regulator
MKNTTIKTLALTNNEKTILKKIVCGNRISDTQISHEMKISQQAVYQIRKRLEDAQIIKGYMPILDYKKIGINIFFYVGIEILPEMWDQFSEVELEEKISKIPYIYHAARIPSSDISYILIFGFKDLEKTEEFSYKIKIYLSHQIKIVWSHTTSVQNFLLHDNVNFICNTLVDDKNRMKDLVETIKKK